MRWVYKLVALTGHNRNREPPVGAEHFSCPRRACYLLFPAVFVTVSPASGEENINFCKLSGPAAFLGAREEPACLAPALLCALAAVFAGEVCSGQQAAPELLTVPVPIACFQRQSD